MRQPVVKVENLVQMRGKKVILNRVSFEVFQGECFGIYGASGTGKTSLLHILAGIDRFKSGSVWVLGYDIKRTEKFKKYTAIVTQERSLFRDLTVAENLDYIAALKNAGKCDVERVIRRLEIMDCLREPVSGLDAGMYQRVSLACAFLNSPRLLLADEILRGLDLQSYRVVLREVLRFLAEGGTCILGTGSLELWEKMNRIGWLEDGALMVYQPQEAWKKWNSLLNALCQPDFSEDDHGNQETLFNEKEEAVTVDGESGETDG